MQIQYQPWLATDYDRYASLCKYDIKYAMGVLDIDSLDSLIAIIGKGHAVMLPRETPYILALVHAQHLVPASNHTDDILAPISMASEAIDFTPLDGKIKHIACGNFHILGLEHPYNVENVEYGYLARGLVDQAADIIGVHFSMVHTHIYPGAPQTETKYAPIDGTDHYTLLAAPYNEFKETKVKRYVSGELPLSMQSLVDTSPAHKYYEGCIYTMPEIKYSRNDRGNPIPIKITGRARTKYIWRVTWTIIAYYLICRDTMQYDYNVTQLDYAWRRLMYMRVDDFPQWCAANIAEHKKVLDTLGYYAGSTLDEFIKKHRPDKIGRIYVTGYIKQLARQFVLDHRDNTDLSRAQIRDEAARLDISPITLWRAERELGIKIPTQRSARSDSGKGILETLTIETVDGVQTVYYEHFSAAASKACRRHSIRYRKRK